MFERNGQKLGSLLVEDARESKKAKAEPKSEEPKAPETKDDVKPPAKASDTK